MPLTEVSHNLRTLPTLTIADRIKRGREERKLTQTGLAKRITDVSPGDMSVTRSAVAQWETGASSPSYALLPWVAKALNYPASYLAFGDNEPVSVDEDVAATVVMVPEVTYGGNAHSFDIERHWGIPRDLAAQTTKSSESLIIVALNDGSLLPAYQPGTRLLVDVSDTKANAGPCLYHNGINTAFGNLTVVPTESGPRVQIVAKGDDFAWDPNSVTIIGKVRRALTLG